MHEEKKKEEMLYIQILINYYCIYVPHSVIHFVLQHSDQKIKSNQWDNKQQCWCYVLAPSQTFQTKLLFYAGCRNCTRDWKILGPNYIFFYFMWSIFILFILFCLTLFYFNWSDFISFSQKGKKSSISSTKEKCEKL